MSADDDIGRIAEQERRLVFQRFDAETAWELGQRLRHRASEERLAVSIDITLHAMPVFYTALDGSTADNARWIRRKRNVTLHFFKSSYRIGLMLATQETTLQAKFGLSDTDYAAHGGSFPIAVEGGGCIGAVTLSGLPQREDHAIVVRVLAEMLGHDAGSLALRG